MDHVSALSSIMKIPAHFFCTLFYLIMHISLILHSQAHHSTTQVLHSFATFKHTSCSLAPTLQLCLPMQPKNLPGRSSYSPFLIKLLRNRKCFIFTLELLFLFVSDESLMLVPHLSFSFMKLKL